MTDKVSSYLLAVSLESINRDEQAWLVLWDEVNMAAPARAQLLSVDVLRKI